MYYGTPQQTFTDQDLISLTFRQSADPIFGNLPEAELVVELYSEATLKPQQEEKLEVYCDADLYLTAYVRECVRNGKRYRLRARPYAEFLETEFLGNMYEGSSLVTVLQDIFQEHYPGLSSDITRRDVTGYLPPGTRRDCLEQLTFGAGGMLVVDKDGTFKITNPVGKWSQMIDVDKLVDKKQVTMLPTYTQFELVAHSYTKGQTEKLLKSQEEMTPGKVVLKFQEPHWHYRDSVEYGNMILEFGTNHVEIEQTGMLTLYGKPWLHTTEYKTLASRQPIDGRFSHKMTVRDKTLINQNNVAAQLQQMRDVGECRFLMEMGYVADRMDGLPWVGERIILPKFMGIVVEQTLRLTGNRVYMDMVVQTSQLPDS